MRSASCVRVPDSCPKHGVQAAVLTPPPLERSHKGKFELTYVSSRAVIVKTLASGARIVLRSVYGYEARPRARAHLPLIICRRLRPVHRE